MEFVKSAMVGVVTDGLAKRVFAGAPYSVGAKTGTAQVVSIGANQRYNANALPQSLRDNSLFVAFAPADHPKIALAVVVENGGWGAQSAGPLARQVLDYYLLRASEPGGEQEEIQHALDATGQSPFSDEESKDADSAGVPSITTGT